VLKVPEGLEPELWDRLVATGGGELPKRMGIEFVELSAERSVARMPVEGNRQVVGILHGGAHVVLGESLGSISSAIHGGPGRIAMGIDINATHTGSITEGWVVGTCTAIALTKNMAVHEIIVTEESTGRRLSTVRITNVLKDRR
jgi:1,4-dihydroxy-2-naphthoyl-CoA hydrolase